MEGNIALWLESCKHGKIGCESQGKESENRVSNFKVRKRETN